MDKNLEMLAEKWCEINGYDFIGIDTVLKDGRLEITAHKGKQDDKGRLIQYELTIDVSELSAPQDFYYIVVNEWLYPTESGRDLVEEFDTKMEAMKRCAEECDKELSNYENVCGDALWPCRFSNTKDDDSEGYIISAKNGLDEWVFYSRVITVKKLCK